MKGCFISGVAAVAALVTTSALAEGHGHRHGSRQAGAVQSTQSEGGGARDVVVRDVQVRDVVVNPPPAPRPDPATARPFLPDVISRPPLSRYARPLTRTNPSATRYGRRSYYAFAPRSNVGYGLVVGYPVGYPYPWVYPFIYEAPAPQMPTVTAPPRNTYSNVEGVTPGTPISAALGCGVDASVPTPCGGLSFDVLPSEAQVSVEGIFVGTVERFSPWQPPLVLSPGQHYVEIRMPGYHTVAFEVTVGAGEVTPYQGLLEPLRTR